MKPTDFQKQNFLVRMFRRRYVLVAFVTTLYDYLFSKSDLEYRRIFGRTRWQEFWIKNRAVADLRMGNCFNLREFIEDIKSRMTPEELERYNKLQEIER